MKKDKKKVQYLLLPLNLTNNKYATKKNNNNKYVQIVSPSGVLKDIRCLGGCFLTKLIREQA